MPELALDLEVLRRGRRVDVFHVTGDPDSHDWLRSELRRWLTDNRWDRGRWGEFTMDVRESGRSKRLKEIRP